MLNLIPTFKPNQKVIVHFKKVEDRCPKCGENPMDKAEPRDIEGIIKEPGSGMFECDCGHIWPVPEGYWIVSIGEGHAYCMPYPLIEAINA